MIKYIQLIADIIGNCGCTGFDYCRRFIDFAVKSGNSLVPAHFSPSRYSSVSTPGPGFRDIGIDPIPDIHPDPSVPSKHVSRFEVRGA